MNGDEELPILVGLAMCLAKRERDSSGCRASGVTPELPLGAGSAPVSSSGCNVNRIIIDISWIALGSVVFAR